MRLIEIHHEYSRYLLLESKDKAFEEHIKRTLLRNVFDEWISLLEREQEKFLLGSPVFIEYPSRQHDDVVRITCRAEVYTFDD